MKYSTVLVCFCVFTLCNANNKYTIKGEGVSEAEKDIIIKKHNYCRKLIENGKVPGQPKGKNFKQLGECINVFHMHGVLVGYVTNDRAGFVLSDSPRWPTEAAASASWLCRGVCTGTPLGWPKWDPHLAEEAQKIADTCRFKHVLVNDTRWPVGQNLRNKRTTNLRKVADWDTTVEKWFDENKKYMYGNNSIPGTGHYTQVIWDTTEYVGCGYTVFKKRKTKFKYQQLYVCNYGPSGNIKGLPPYQIDIENPLDKIPVIPL